MSAEILETENAQAESSVAEETSTVDSSTENTEELDTSNNDTESEQESEDEGQGESEHKPRKNGFKKRLDREKRKIAEKDQEIDYWKREALKRMESEKQTPTKADSKAGDLDKEPNQDDFDSVGEYAKALAKYEAAQIRKEARENLKKEEIQTKQSSIQKEYNTKLNEFKKTATDFDEVVSDFAENYGDFNASPEVFEALLTSDFGPQIVYEVMKNPSEYERLSKLSPLSVIREIGKMEAKLAAKSELKSQAVKSKAPAPVNPIGKGSASVSKSIYDPNISFEEYEKARAQQLKKK